MTLRSYKLSAVTQWKSHLLCHDNELSRLYCRRKHGTPWLAPGILIVNSNSLTTQQR